MGGRGSKQSLPGVARNDPEADVGTGKVQDPKAIEKAYPKQTPQANISNPVLAPPNTADPSPYSRSGIISANPSAVRPVMRVRADAGPQTAQEILPNLMPKTDKGEPAAAADTHHPRTVVALVDDEGSVNDPGFKFGLQAATPEGMFATHRPHRSPNHTCTARAPSRTQ
jgi:hypothetical protein